MNYQLLYFNTFILHFIFSATLTYKNGSFRSYLILVTAYLLVLINCHHASTIEGMSHRESHVRDKLPLSQIYNPKRFAYLYFCIIQRGSAQDKVGSDPFHDDDIEDDRIVFTYIYIYIF